MEVLNHRAVPGGMVDCTVEHPELGTIPYTASPSATDEFGRDVWASILAEGLPTVDGDTLRTSLLEEVTSLRDEGIAAGTLYGERPIHTDDQSQQRATGAAVAAGFDSSYSVGWKFADGTFATLGAQEIIEMASTIQEHVQACFNAEAIVSAQIEALEEAELGGFDVGAAYAAARG